jgi:2'-5' RNA ligase
MGRMSAARLRTLGWRTNDRLDPDFRCLTTVIRIPEPVGVRIESALREIRERWPEHAYYPPSSMHVTILNLDPYVAAGEGEAGEAAVVARATEVLATHRRFRITLRGLNVSPWTVFAQAHEADAPVSRLRGSLRGAFEEQRDAPRRDSPLRRALPLVLSNAVRFRGPVDPALLRALRPWRARMFGPFEVREVEVARSDGFYSAERTQVLATAELRPLSAIR